MIESETVAVGLDGVLPVLKSGVVVVVVAVPADVLCISAVAVIATEEALAVFVAAVNDSVVSETLPISPSSSPSEGKVLLMVMRMTMVIYVRAYKAKLFRYIFVIVT